RARRRGDREHQDNTRHHGTSTVRLKPDATYFRSARLLLEREAFSRASATSGSARLQARAPPFPYSSAARLLFPAAATRSRRRAARTAPRARCRRRKWSAPPPIR